MSSRMPVLFIAHGAPPLLDDAGWLGELRAWGEALPRPKAILMISAHFEARPLTLSATTTVPLLYDFYGFPERYYKVTYPAPGAPELAARIRELMGAHSLAVQEDPTRGLDHGSFIPLMAMFPKADVPVIQLSLPTLEPRTLYQLGQWLAPLRDEGVLIAGNGFLVHNLRALGQPLAPWARDFDAWVADALTRDDVEGLLDFEARAPGARLAHPRTEHFVPLLMAMGARSETRERPTFPITGWWLGSFTKRSVQWG